MDSSPSSVHIPSQCAKRDWNYIMGPYVTEKPLFRTFQPSSKQVTNGKSTNSEPSKVETKTRNQGGRKLKNSTPNKAAAEAIKLKDKAFKAPARNNSPPQKRGPPAVPVSPPVPLKSSRISSIPLAAVIKVKQDTTAETFMSDCSLVRRVTDSSLRSDAVKEQLVNTQPTITVSMKVVDDCNGDDLEEVCFATSNSLSETQCTSAWDADIPSSLKALDTEGTSYTVCKQTATNIPHSSVSDNENERDDKKDFTFDIDASMETLYKQVMEARAIKHLLKSQLPNATSSTEEHKIQTLLKEARMQFKVLCLEYNARVIQCREQMSLVANEATITQ